MKKILLLGDSIRRGYDLYVEKAFEGLAKVYYPIEQYPYGNCQFAAFTLRHLNEWKGNLGCGDDVDLVHWNCGLWDCLRMIDGELHTPLAYYKDYMQRICNVLKRLFPKAKIIFATTTPVQEELFTGDLKRLNKDVVAYNEAAIEIMQKNGIEINDLYALVAGFPKSYYSDSTHLYTRNGTEQIANQVISVLEKALSMQAKTLNYSEYFPEENVVGM